MLAALPLEAQSDGSHILRSATGPWVGVERVRIHLCVRRTLDWSRSEGLADRVLPSFRPKFEAWNETFDLSYGAFRQRLKEIAELSLSRVDGAACTALEKVPAGDLILPVDDDDWFAPNVAQEIRQAVEPDRAGYYWIREVISPSRRRRKLRNVLWPRRRRGSYTCKTNNYAVINTPELRPLVGRHTDASEFFDAHPDRVRRIPKTLAIQNRNLASRTALAWKRPTISREELVQAYESYANLYAGWELPRDLRWAQPYMDRMAELMREVRVR
jgi:hypothetical protein